jgi:hypothetical protein
MVKLSELKMSVGDRYEINSKRFYSELMETANADSDGFGLEPIAFCLSTIFGNSREYQPRRGDMQ